MAQVCTYQLIREESGEGRVEFFVVQMLEKRLLEIPGRICSWGVSVVYSNNIQ
jgi:hypothetical protein